MNQDIETLNLIPIRSNMINQLKNIQDILIDMNNIELNKTEKNYINAIMKLVDILIGEVVDNQIKQIDWKPSIINRIKAGD